MDIFVLLALALAPGVAIAVFIYFKDKHEREPLGLLVKSFFFGVLSVLLVFAISAAIDMFVTINEQDAGQQAVHAFFIVALVEEFSKFIFVWGILYRDKNFNEPFDGIVYSVMVGMGFATFENLIYVYDTGLGGAILRMFTAVPAHATFAVLMGYYLGKAKFEPNKSHYAFYGLAAATLFHGAYDYCLFMTYYPGIWIGAFVSLVVGIALSRKAIAIHQDASPFKANAAGVIVQNEVDGTEQPPGAA